MPLYEVCLKADDIYSLRIIATNSDDAVYKAMGIVTNVSEKNLPNYDIQVIEIESDQPKYTVYRDAVNDP